MQLARQKKDGARHNVAGLLELWDKLELVIEDGGRIGRYRARVEDITSTHLIIDRPTLVSGDALFTVGAQFTANFFKPDSAYTFTGRIASKHNGRADVYEVPLPTDIERNQRRRYFRIEIRGSATLIPAEDLLAQRRGESGLPQFDAKCLNLSGNGVLVQSRLDTEAGLRILVSLHLDDYAREINTLGIVRRRANAADDLRDYGIELFTTEELPMVLKSNEIKQIPKQYQNFSEIQRTKLLNFIFEQQVELKKKGLI